MQCQPAHGILRAVSARAAGRRCGFARRGLNAPEMLACPGFDSLAVSYPPVHRGQAETAGFTCAHLQLSETQRGYAAVCGHPDGPFDQWLPPLRGSTSGGRR